MTPTTDFVEQQEEEKTSVRAALERRCNWIAAGIGILIAIAILLLVY